MRDRPFPVLKGLLFSLPSLQKLFGPPPLRALQVKHITKHKALYNPPKQYHSNIKIGWERKKVEEYGIEDDDQGKKICTAEDEEILQYDEVLWLEVIGEYLLACFIMRGKIRGKKREMK